MVGAGAFGGWTALHLLRAGATVTLLDAWGGGNSRSSSGGETRIIRGTYGPDQPYTEIAARSLRMWKENEARWGCQLFHPAGVLWMAGDGNDEFERGSLPMLREYGFKYEELSVDRMRQRWPQVHLDDVHWGIYEPESGYLTARVACQRVQQAFVEEGGEYRQANARWAGDGLTLSDRSRLAADQYVFACGPWLGELFPDVVGRCVTATKQDVFFLALRREMTGSRKESFRCGRIIVAGSCTAFQKYRDEASRWRRTRVVRFLIPHTENGLWMERPCAEYAITWSSASLLCVVPH